jgi:agmatinase
VSHLPYGGVATFARAPLVPPEWDWRADVGVLGVPFDLAVGFRPGARFAPRALREASLRYALPPEGFYDLLTDRRRLAGVTLADAGDVVVPALEPELMRARTTEAARRVRARVRLPVFLGGDHSVSYPLLRAFDDVPELHVVQLDAHLDFTDERNGTRYSNSSPFRRAAEALPNLAHITTLGLRGLRFDAEAVRAARARGHTLVPMRELLEDLEGVLGRLPTGKPVYLSVDADAFDPAALPGTSSPEPDGLSYALAAQLIAETVRRNPLVGLDFVELAPNLDPTGRSALLGARLIMETLCEVLDG